MIDVADVTVVDLAGIDFVTSANIDTAHIQSSPAAPTVDSNQQTVRRKRMHAAAEAANWSANSFTSSQSRRPRITHVDSANLAVTCIPEASLPTTGTDGSRGKWPINRSAMIQPDPTAPVLVLSNPDLKTSQSRQAPRFVPRQVGGQIKSAAMKSHPTVVKNSMILKKVQGARLPPEVESELRAKSGQAVADNTTLDIRDKIKKVGECVATISVL